MVKRSAAGACVRNFRHANRTGRKEAAGLPPDPSGRQGRACPGPGSMHRRWPGQGPPASTARPAARCLFPLPAARSRQPFSGSAMRMSTSALGAGALGQGAARRRLAFRQRARQSDACDAWRRAGRLCLHALRQEAGQGHPPDRARRRGCSLYQAHRRGRVSGARPRQHADQRHGTGRTRTGRARAGAQAQGKSLGRQGRRPAGEELSDDPCGRPRLRQGAAADRSWSGATGTRRR